MTKKIRLRRASVLVLAAMFAVAGMATSATATLAKRPGGGGGGGGSASCALTSAGVGQPLLLTGSGFAANSQYIVSMSSPGGTGMTTVNSGPSGSLVAGNFWTYWSGTYSAQILSEGHQSSLVTSCSTTVP